MEKKTIEKLIVSNIKIQSNFIWYKRLYVLIKNPITYLFKGYVEY